MWDRGAGLLKYFHAGPAQSGRQEGKTAGKYRAAGRKCPTREKEMRIGHGNKWKMKMHIIAV